MLREDLSCDFCVFKSLVGMWGGLKLTLIEATNKKTQNMRLLIIKNCNVLMKIQQVLVKVGDNFTLVVFESDVTCKRQFKSIKSIKPSKIRNNLKTPYFPSFLMLNWINCSDFHILHKHYKSLKVQITFNQNLGQNCVQNP